MKMMGLILVEVSNGRWNNGGVRVDDNQLAEASNLKSVVESIHISLLVEKLESSSPFLLVLTLVLASTPNPTFPLVLRSANTVLF